jgi:hypothetical protein
LQIGIQDAYSGRRELRLVPGTQDLTIKLSLEKNPSSDCEGFNYYDKFESIDFEFIVDSDDETYIADQPNVEVRVASIAKEVER